jgi:hypothetical protein
MAVLDHKFAAKPDEWVGHKAMAKAFAAGVLECVGQGRPVQRKSKVVLLVGDGA